MRKSYLIAASLLWVTYAQAAETITTTHFQATLLGAEETKNIIEKGIKSPIKGVEPWTEEHRVAIARSLEMLERSFDFSENPEQRMMEIAFALEKGAYLGGSSPTLISNNEHVVSASEELLRDGENINYGDDVVDDAVWMFTSVPLYFGEGLPDHGEYDFESTVTHEILHAMGFMNMNKENGSYPSGLTKWDTLLQDINGNKPSYGDVPSLLTKGKAGTVFWTGKHANATYGGPVPLQTFIDEYLFGASLSHPVVFGELMHWQGFPVSTARDINKLQLDMFRDMGWSINEHYYNSFGPTFYRNDSTIINNDDFSTTHSHTYAMHVNGYGNTILQNANLITTQEQIKVLSVHGNSNQLNINGTLRAEGDYSVGLYWLTDPGSPGDGTITINNTASLEVTGTDSIGLFINGTNNTIMHSGSISATENATTAIRLDYISNVPRKRLAEVHIQDGATIKGNIVNSHPSVTALMTFGRKYDGGSYTADDTFRFDYNDTISGLWDYDFHVGTITFGNTLTLQDSGLIKGNATIISDINSSGTIAPGNSVGTLSINGNLNQSPTSNLEIEFDENGHDQLEVTGTVTLDGALTLVPLGYLAPGTYQFLNAGTITNNFTTVNNYLSAILETSTSSIDSFTLARNSYKTVTGNSFATSLDSARATATGDMAKVLNQLDLMNISGLKSATSDLSPYIYNSVTTANIEAVHNRASFLRNKMKSESQNEASPLWFSAYNGKTHYDQMSTSDACTAQQKGLMFGGTSNYTTGFRLGGGVSFTDFDLDEKNSTSSSSGSIYDFYLYGTWTPQTNQSFYIHAVLGAGLSDFDTDREITFLKRMANGKQDATHYSAFVGGGYNYTTGAWNLQPRIGVEYIYLNEDSFTETGAESVSLRVDSKKSDSVISSIGVNISHKFQLEKSIIMPSLNIDWFHNFSTSTDKTTGRLQSGESYSVAGRGGSEDALKIGAGIRIIASDLVHGYVDYEYTFANNQDRSHMISTGLSYKF